MQRLWRRAACSESVSDGERRRSACRTLLPSKVAARERVWCVGKEMERCSWLSDLTLKSIIQLSSFAAVTILGCWIVVYYVHRISRLCWFIRTYSNKAVVRLCGALSRWGVYGIVKQGAYLHRIWIRTTLDILPRSKKTYTSSFKFLGTMDGVWV